jgi:hypothetical protein
MGGRLQIGMHGRLRRNPQSTGNGERGLLRNTMNGEWVDSGRTFANVNPVNSTKVCDIFDAYQAAVSVYTALGAMYGDWVYLTGDS